MFVRSINTAKEGTGFLLGKEVCISGRTPKMQLAPGDYITKEFRAEIDAWLIDFFGYNELVKDDEVIEVMGSQLFMNRSTYQKLLRALQ